MILVTGTDAVEARMAAARLLGVPAGTPDDVLRRVVRKKARTEHPDVGGDRERWEAIRAAYELLITPIETTSVTPPEPHLRVVYGPVSLARNLRIWWRPIALALTTTLAFLLALSPATGYVAALAWILAGEYMLAMLWTALGRPQLGLGALAWRKWRERFPDE